MAALSHAADAKPLIEWQADHFSPLELSDHTVSGPMADPDGDGLPNLHEYHFGADPRLPDAPAHLPVLERAGDAYTLRHRHALDADDSVAWLQASPDLCHWVTYGFEAEVARVELGDASDIILADIEGIEPETRFLRLRVDLAPFDFSLRAPSGLTLTLYSPTEWELAWNDLNLAETAYEIQRLSPRTGLWLPLGTTSPNQISWFDAEADASAGIKYRVLARDAYGNSLASDPVSPLDSDGDGLPDALELAAAYAGATGTYGSSPMHARDPFSGVLDSWAPLYGYTGTPGAADADSDGLDDLAEAQNHLDPFSDDTDHDGRSDAWELENGFDPLVRHSPYLLLPAGPLPISFSSDAKRIHFANSDGMVIEAGRYVISPDLPTEHATSWYKSATFMGSSGLVVTKAADLSQEGNLAQRHYQLLVWPGDGHDPFKIKGVPSYDETYVSEGFPAQWSSNVRFNAIDLLGRVWCTVETGSNTHELRCYLSDGTYTVQTSGADYGLGFVTVLQSNGDTTIGYFDDWQNGIVGPFVGRPLPADRVDYLPLAVNRGGDILGDDSEPYFYTDRLDMDQRVLDAETASAKSLQNHLGTYVDHAFVTGNDGVRHSLPWDAMEITGFDDEANVYGRELDGRPVVWMADPEAWGHPLGTPRYTAAPYTPPVLPTGLKPLVNVRPDPLPRVELVQVGREDLAQNGLGWGQLIFPASLAVDYNRDGQIDFVKDTEVDATSEFRTFRFWSNDDIDRDDKDLTTGHAPDWQDGLIQCVRDLEDFARIQISLGGLRDAFATGNMRLGLEWKQTTGNPSIQLYPQMDQTGSNDYLKDQQKAGAQIEPGIPTGRWALQSQPGATLIGVGQPLILPASVSDIYFPNFLSTGLMPLLFEGCTEGKGQLCLTIHDANGVKIGDGPGVWIEIKNIKAMYERARATTNYAMSPNGIDYTMPLPHDTLSTQPPEPIMGWEPDNRGVTFVPDPTEDTVNKRYVVFVHGWRQSPNEINPGTVGYSSSTAFAETMFKRLWHTGYRGRFAAFRWPTLYGGPSPDDDFIAGYTTYNDSEYRAWKSGESLKKYVNGEPSSDSSGVTGLAPGYRLNLAAHSMGNIVVGSAFQRGMQVDQYMMLNAAVPAIAYDAGAPRNPLGLSQELQDLIDSISSSLQPTLDNTPNDDPEPDIRAKAYVNQLQNIGGGSARVINFYLEADSATRSSWNANNIAFRPQPFAWPKGPGYSYNRAATYSKLNLDKHGMVNEGRAVTDPHEVMSYDCKSPTQTVNAEGSSTNGPIDEKVDMSAYGFGSEHSAEWQRNMQQAHMFYQTFFDKVNRSSP